MSRRVHAAWQVPQQRLFLVQFLGVLSLVCFLIAPGSVCAQAETKPDFFIKDYAKSPLQPRGTPDSNRTGTAQSTSESGVHSPDAPQNEAGWVNMGEATPTPVVGEESEEPHSILPSSEVVPIKSIGAILNGKDLAHFEEQLGKLQDFIMKYERNGLKAGTIYAVGMRKVFDRTRFTPLFGRGVVFKMVETPPKKYQVARSPTWVLRAEKGEILLEGTGALERNFTAKGEFVEKGG